MYKNLRLVLILLVIFLWILIRKLDRRWKNKSSKGCKLLLNHCETENEPPKKSVIILLDSQTAMIHTIGQKQELFTGLNYPKTRGTSFDSPMEEKTPSPTDSCVLHQDDLLEL